MYLVKWLLVSGVIALTLVALVLLAVVWIENNQAEENSLRLQQQHDKNKTHATVAVIVFSRSGNTAVLGKHLAKKHSADFYRLRADDYEPGFKGLISALTDARGHEADIAPNTMDLGRYDSIYLGSPIWLYSPAPPIWQFAKNNRFDGKSVILFNTFNSKFEQKYIDNFYKLVSENGAKSFDHRYIKRGRMGQQITTDVMLEKFDENSGQ